MSSKPLRDGASGISGDAAAAPPEPVKASPAPVEPVPSTANDLDYSNFFWGSGKDPFDILGPFDDWFDEARPAGYYLFGQPMSSAPRTHIDVVEQLVQMRNDGMGWGRIAAGLDLRLGSVVSAVKAEGRVA